jgi:hypothetical protein
MVDAWSGMEGRSKSNVKGSTALSHVTTQDAQIRCAALQVFNASASSVSLAYS